MRAQGHKPRMRTQTRDLGLDHVVVWRREQLVRSGVPFSMAAQAASNGGYDLHALIELLGRGCPPEFAIRILAPLESENGA